MFFIVFELQRTKEGKEISQGTFFEDYKNFLIHCDTKPSVAKCLALISKEGMAFYHYKDVTFSLAIYCHTGASEHALGMVKNIDLAFLTWRLARAFAFGINAGDTSEGVECPFVCSLWEICVEISSICCLRLLIVC